MGSLFFRELGKIEQELFFSLFLFLFLHETELRKKEEGKKRKLQPPLEDEDGRRIQIPIWGSLYTFYNVCTDSTVFFLEEGRRDVNAKKKRAMGGEGKKRQKEREKNK